MDADEYHDQELVQELRNVANAVLDSDGVPGTKEAVMLSELVIEMDSRGLLLGD